MSAVVKIKLSHVDKDKCEACERCVVIAGESFEMTEEDGKVFSSFISDNSSKLKLCLTSCPNHAIISKSEKSDNVELVHDMEKCGACAECVKLSPDSFEIVEEDGQIKAHMKNADVAKAHHLIMVCENKALKLKTK